MEETVKNPLGTEKISRLLAKFAIPSIIAMVVGACYNIIDQLFIGNVIGELGNAATNIVYPLTNLCLAFGLMYGHGGAAAFNLRMGAGKKKEAPYFLGNSATMLIIIGVVIGLLVEVFCDPVLMLCGSTTSVLPFAHDYAVILALGFPAAVFSMGAGHLIRADGRPNVIMITNILGAIINIGLDAWFIVGLGMEMKGAALATIIGQYAAAAIQFYFVFNFKTVKVSLKHYVPKLKYFGNAAKLGLTAFINQIAMMIVQIVLNNQLNIYGGQSIYGKEIPLAVAGITIKVSTIFSGIIIGITQGFQPIISFNYGAENYRRVKETFFRAFIIAFIVSIINFIIYQCFPDFILGLFGSGSDLYFEFGRKFFRIYIFFCCLFFIQMMSANMFTAIGKPGRGIFLSLTRQIIFLLPLLLILPGIFGIDGVIFAQPVSDFVSITVSMIFLIKEYTREEYKKEKGVLKEIFIKKKEKDIG